MESLNVRLRSIGPMLMHSCVLADPLNQLSKEYKKLTSKRKKTDEDHEAIAKASWRASLYYDDEIGPFIPAINIEATIFESAKLRKLGKIAKRAIFILQDKIKLEYSGPRDPDKMFLNSKFVDARPVKVQTSRLIRYRPKFDEWFCDVSINFNPEQIDRTELISVLQDAGSLVGTGDFRPRFGKFEVEVI